MCIWMVPHINPVEERWQARGADQIPSNLSKTHEHSGIDEPRRAGRQGADKQEVLAPPWRSSSAGKIQSKSQKTTENTSDGATPFLCLHSFSPSPLPPLTQATAHAPFVSHPLSTPSCLHFLVGPHVVIELVLLPLTLLLILVAYHVPLSPHPRIRPRLPCLLLSALARLLGRRCCRRRLGCSALPADLNGGEVLCRGAYQGVCDRCSVVREEEERKQKDEPRRQ